MAKVVSTDSLSNFLQDAEQLLQHKCYQELHSACTQFLSSTPESFLVLFFKAEALVGLGKLEQALPMYEQAARLSEVENNAEFKATYAKLLEAKKNTKATEQSSKQAISIEPASYQALVNRATAHLAAERAEEALEDLERALSIDNTQLYAHLKRFEVLVRLDRPKQMLAAANDLVLLTPNQSIGYFYLGIALFRLGEDEESSSAYTKALKLAPRDVASYINRSATYASQGHMENALADCENALSIKPKHLSALVNKALCLRTTGQPEKAIKVCNEAISVEPDCALAYCNRAMANFILNRTKQALDDVELSIRFAKQPMYVAKCKAIKAKFLGDGGGGGGGGTSGGDGGAGGGGHERGGRGNSDVGGRDRLAEARQLCDSAVRMAPENSHPWRYAWSTSALISGLMGDFEAANSNVQLVLDRSKGFIYGINIKAQLLLMQDRTDDALLAVNSALALNPKDPESNYICYLIRTKQADPRASDDLTKARQLGYLRDDA